MEIANSSNLFIKNEKTTQCHNQKPIPDCTLWWKPHILQLLFNFRLLCLMEMLACISWGIWSSILHFALIPIVFNLTLSHCHWHFYFPKYTLEENIYRDLHQHSNTKAVKMGDYQVVFMKSQDFWDMKLCQLINSLCHFKQGHCHSLHIPRT